MSFTEMLAELPALSIAERQAVIRRALELDDPGLSSADELLIERRLSDHRRDPKSAISLDDMKDRFRDRRAK
jgi:hypothetical protein